MNRRILISEDERSRILGLHENRKKQEWGFINEADTSKVIAAYGTVEACKADYDNIWLSGIAQKVTGQNYKVIQKKYLDAKCNGKTPCDTRDISNKNLAMEICEGTFTLDGAVAGSTTTATGSATGTTFAIDNKPTVLNTDQEITDMVKNKKITAETLVFKSPEIPTWTKISALPEDSPIKKAVMAIIATVPPDLPGETFKIIGADGNTTVDMDTAAIEKGIMDKTITAETPVLDSKTNTWSKLGQIEALKPILAKVVPDYKTPQAEMPSTGNKTLDEWLKTQSGQTYLSKPDRPSQEAFIDYLEQSGDPIIASVGGKEALRKILLGDVNKDTKFGRWLQRGGNKVKNVGKVLRGQNVVANTGYNPKRP
jgi:hypothetical protein